VGGGAVGVCRAESCSVAGAVGGSVTVGNSVAVGGSVAVRGSVVAGGDWVVCRAVPVTAGVCGGLRVARGPSDGVAGGTASPATGVGVRAPNTPRETVVVSAGGVGVSEPLENEDAGDSTPPPKLTTSATANAATVTTSATATSDRWVSTHSRQSVSGVSTTAPEWSRSRTSTLGQDCR
jgi:hypothetical protein